jgi:hypothetical protein
MELPFAPPDVVFVAKLVPAPSEDPAVVAVRLETILAGLHGDWSESWQIPLRYSADSGSFRGRLKHAAAAFDCAVTLNLALWPQQVRVVTSDEGAEDALRLLATTKTAFSIRLAELTPGEIDVIEAAAEMHAAMMRDWKPSRAKAVKMSRLVKTQGQAAERLGIRQQSVSEALRAGHAKQLAACEAAIRKRLEELGG